MKKRFLALLYLFLVFLCFWTFVVFWNYKKADFKVQKTKFYKILQVVEADKIYIDLNGNDKIDSGEFFKISGITAFYPTKNFYSELNAKKLGLSFETFLINGYLTRKWANDNLVNKKVKIYPLKQCKIDADYHCARIEFQGKDLAEILLENGLAYLDKSYLNLKYLQSENLKQAVYNVSQTNPDDFLIVNKKSNIAHKLSCDFAKNISSGEIIPTAEFYNNKTKVHPCRVCFNSSVKNKTSKPFVVDSDFVFRGFDYYKIPKSKGVYKNSVYKKINNDIKLFLINPLMKSKPDDTCSTDICKEIVSLIDGSDTSIDAALYGVGNQKEIINALDRALLRGVKIRAVVDNSSNSGNVYQYTNEFSKKFNTVVNPQKSLMHNKFFIFDDKKVLLGSANISPTGTGGYNANIIIMVNSSELASIYKKEFEQMFLKNKFSLHKDKIFSSKINVSDVIVMPHFSPKGDIFENAIKPLIKNAKTEIFVSAFYLTDKGLIDELIEAKNRGVRVLCLVDALGAMNAKEKIKILRKNDIPTIVENWGGKNHEKTIMVDSKYLLIGSLNFSKSGFNKNNENLLVVDSPFAASLYRDYYLYLYNSIDEKYLNYFIRAESLESKNSCFDGIDNDFDGKIDSDDDGCR